MIFKKFKKPKEEMQKTQGNVKLKIPKGSELEKQVRMIELTEKDLRIVNGLQPFVIENIDIIVDRFYKNLENEPSLLRIIHDNSAIERLKKTLKQHISEMFDGVIDETYVEKRIRIAHIHVRIGLKTKWYMCAFQDLFLSLVRIIEEKTVNNEHLLQTIKAVSKMLNLEQQLVLEAYDFETEKIKKQGEEQKKAIREDVTKASQSLATISEETNTSFHQLNEQSNEIVAIAHKGTKLSILAEERAQQGKEQLTKQHANMATIHHSVDDISNDAQVLLTISKRMQEIIKMVTKIAERTNILSLNANIEATRAGEYGRGFTVVAGEVRKLSEETKKSVTNVATLILETNSQVEKLIQSLEKIKGAVSDGKYSMEEAGNNFDQILKTMNETKAQNNKIEFELTAFVKVVDESGEAFEEVASAADRLTMIAQKMD